MERREDDWIRHRPASALEYRHSRRLVGFPEVQDDSVFPDSMKLVKVVAGIILGILAATVVCWGALYLYGVLVLHGRGSLFDTNPLAANVFFVGWGVVSAVCAIAGAFVAVRTSGR
jgi:hypothetical protein